MGGRGDDVGERWWSEYEEMARAEVEPNARDMVVCISRGNCSGELKWGGMGRGGLGGAAFYRWNGK